MSDADGLQVGDEIELDLGAPGHGGITVARYDNRVVFVRFGVPGERVLVRLTQVRPGSFCRGDVVAVRRRSADRVTAPCLHYGPGGCGGCDLMHVSAPAQRQWKADVVAEQLRRLAGLDVPVQVRALPGDGFGWRTRVRWAVQARPDDEGFVALRVGPRGARTHDVVPISPGEPCLIAPPEFSREVADRHNDLLAVTRRESRRPQHGSGRRRRAQPDVEVTLVRDPAGGRPLLVAPGRAAPDITEHAAGHDFSIAADGFWQVHPAAADTLAEAVRKALAERLPAGGTAWDLYGGAGLFAAVLRDLVGPDGSVVTVEGDQRASAQARHNLGDGAETQCGDVADIVAILPGPVDAVVLDPPRSGAGREVCRSISAAGPSTVVYVACDPAALARDTRTLLDAGYHLADLAAFDCFPQTHHVECVATFTR